MHVLRLSHAPIHTVIRVVVMMVASAAFAFFRDERSSWTSHTIDRNRNTKKFNCSTNDEQTHNKLEMSFKMDHLIVWVSMRECGFAFLLCFFFCFALRCCFSSATVLIIRRPGVLSLFSQALLLPVYQWIYSLILRSRDNSLFSMCWTNKNRFHVSFPFAAMFAH